ncbi:hypothetical protein JCM16418_797 [Paenibacillus pini JCM 16418]|uniref:Uncharacterized protein n=2 Tax=Paenibacillus TaxID=44249 RepID=W7Y7A4_9BACL|nr:hypothetical protein JCM16418_797 [Paenibacillus pini JCM 16418]
MGMSKPRKRVIRGANYVIEDESRIPQVFEKIKELRHHEITVGIFGNEELVKKAAIHEYGAPKAGIPERSFLRAGTLKYKSAISKEIRDNIGDVVEGATSVQDLLEKIGSVAAEKVAMYFDKIKEPALLPVTIARRKDKSKKPLIDTKELRDAIKYEVKPKK